jgi:hypothetical protein
LQQRIVVEKASSASCIPSLVSRRTKTLEISLFFLSLAACAGDAEISLPAIRAELPASVEKSGACGF